MSAGFFKIFERPKTAVAAALLLIAAGFLLYRTFLAEPKPKSESKEDLAAFLASDAFRKLSLEKQRYYTSKLRGEPGTRPDFSEMRKTFGALSDTERRSAFENMRIADEVDRNKKALAYVKMSRAERDAFLDREIAEMDKRFAEMRKNFEQRPANRQEQQPSGARPNSGETQEQREANRTARMKSRTESTPPEVRAARELMMREMMARRQATGKSMPRPPGGGRGGPPPM